MNIFQDFQPIVLYAVIFILILAVSYFFSTNIQNWIRKMIPSPRKRYRFGLRSISIVSATVCTYFISYYFEEKLYHQGIYPLIGICIVSIFEFIVAEVLADNQYPKRTEKILERLGNKIHLYEKNITTILNETIQKLNVPNKQNVSGTFHLKVELYADHSSEETETALVQVIRYAGNLGGRRWRFTLATKGIIGRCLRTAGFQEVDFIDQDDFKKRMVEEFSFTEIEASKVSFGKAYCAFPVIDDNKVIGVLYLFSSDQFIFSQCIAIQELQNAASQINAYLKGAELVHG